MPNTYPGEILLGKRWITADTAMRLARAFETSEHFWLGLQADYDLEQTRLDHGEDLMRIPNIPAWSVDRTDWGVKIQSSGFGLRLVDCAIPRWQHFLG
jgi:hypothetical protein